MMSEKSECATQQQQRLRIAETNAKSIHGNTVILPGDDVMIQSHWCRIIEVYPDQQRVKIYRLESLYSAIETMHATVITDYRPRDHRQ
jgi:hypothetical protein